MPITRPTRYDPPPTEIWTHPKSGERLRRQCLGACLGGRLALKRCPETGTTNVFWVGRGKVDFDETLQRTLTIHKAAEPVELTEGLWWISRLPAGDYRLEERHGGGMLLYQVFGQGQSRRLRRSPVAVRNIH